MRKTVVLLLPAFLLAGLLADDARANGASGLLVENLEWNDRVLLAHDVHLISSYSEDGYCDFDGIKLREGALFIPFKTEMIIPWSDLLSAGKTDTGLCAEASAKIVFKYTRTQQLRAHPCAQPCFGRLREDRQNQDAILRGCHQAL